MTTDVIRCRSRLKRKNTRRARPENPRTRRPSAGTRIQPETGIPARHRAREARPPPPPSRAVNVLPSRSPSAKSTSSSREPRTRRTHAPPSRPSPRAREIPPLLLLLRRPSPHRSLAEPTDTAPRGGDFVPFAFGKGAGVRDGLRPGGARRAPPRGWDLGPVLRPAAHGVVASERGAASPPPPRTLRTRRSHRRRSRRTSYL